MFYLVEDFFHAHNTSTGYSNDHNFGAVNQSFLHELDDGSTIAAFYNHSHFLFQGREETGKILNAERIPDDLIDLLRFRNKAWRGMKRIETLLIPYDNIHILQHIGYNLFQFINTHGCASLPEWSGPNLCICLVKSVTVRCHRCPSEADIHV
jgi:hypothetical protein